MLSPFPSTSSSIPGKGDIHLSLLPPSTPAFSHLAYTYPLKLLPSIPHKLTPLRSRAASPQTPSSNDATLQPPPPSPDSVPLLFLLTYGGGLVAGDHIDVSIRLDPGTRLTITTQGSTKIFRPASTPASSTTTTTPPTTRQDLDVHISNHAALWMAPDPVQPYAGSFYAQRQIFNVERGGSLGLVDWVSEGRKARGERWAFAAWRGRNEIWEVYDGEGVQQQQQQTRRGRRMLVRDAVVLENGRKDDDVRARMDGAGVFGTVLLRGALFESLARFFVDEFKALPRIGGRNWTEAGDATVHEITVKEEWRKRRLQKEKEDGVLWTACHVRGCTIVKFAATEVEGAKVWLGSMLNEEGSVGREFGNGGLMFVR